jgi:Tfp pilus assembly protein PilO
MKPLFDAGPPVPLGRVLREHRAALVPLGIVLAINVVVLGALVVPLSRNVVGNEARADAASRAQQTAAAEAGEAERLREGKARTTSDLERFYAEVLPPDVAAARRLMQLGFQQKARAHGVRFQRSSTNEEELRDSALDRLTASMTLSGSYDDIRALLFDLEEAPDFVVIDNLVLSDGNASDSLTLVLEVSTYFRSVRPPRRTGALDGR